MKIELKQPTEPGANAGDMFCGHPDDPATVTHGWCGTQWHQTISDEWAAAVHYRAEAELLKTCGVTELMARNPNVSAYVAEAEAKVACLTAERDAAVARAATELAISRFENYFADDPVLAGHGHSASLADELRTPEAASALDAVKRAEQTQTLRDAAARAYEVAHNTNDISQIRDAILAMIPKEITESDS